MDLMSLLTLGIKPLYLKNVSFYKLVFEFRNKLPRPQNEARKITHEEIDADPNWPNYLKSINAIDVSTHKTSLTESDLDIFFNSIRYFDYSWMFFKNYYKGYSHEILRLEPKTENKNIGLVMLQHILKEDPLLPLKPIDVLIHHLKFEYKLSSAVYLWFDSIRRAKL